MRSVIYTTVSNYYAAESLRELRAHVQSINNVHQRNVFDGDYVVRLAYNGMVWVRDYSFYAQINVVKGRVILRRVNVNYTPGVGFSL